MSGVKQAALLLHGLSRTDQDWLMTQLDAPQRELISRTLDELRALGIPRDPGLIDAVLGRGTPQERLARASGETVLRAMEGETPEAVAMLLRLHPWPWRQAVIAHWAPVFQTRPELLAPRQAESAPALNAALIEAVIRRVGCHADSAEPIEQAPQKRRGPAWMRPRTRRAA
jgi:hypothetical protein